MFLHGTPYKFSLHRGLPRYRRDHLQITLYQSDSLPIQQLQLIQYLYDLPYSRLRFRNSRGMLVGSVRERTASDSFRNQIFHWPVLCHHVLQKSKKSKPKRETKQTRILCSSQRKLDLTTLTAPFQEVDYLAIPQRQVGGMEHRQEQTICPSLDKSRFGLELLLRRMFIHVI